MTSVASRDLRNHTADVLKQVADGTDVTITVHGRPVALITRPRSTRPHTWTAADFLRRRAESLPDTGLRADIAWISAGTTDDLGDP